MKKLKDRCCELCKTDKGRLIGGVYRHYKTKVIPSMEWCIKTSWFNGFIKLMEKVEVNRVTTIKVYSKVRLCPKCADFCKGRDDDVENWIFTPNDSDSNDSHRNWWRKDELDNWYIDDSGAKA